MQTQAQKLPDGWSLTERGAEKGAGRFRSKRVEINDEEIFIESMDELDEERAPLAVVAAIMRRAGWTVEPPASEKRRRTG